MKNSGVPALRKYKRERIMKKFKKWLGGFRTFWIRLFERWRGPLQKPIAIANRFSLVLHVLMSWMIYFVMEAVSRHSVAAAWTFMTESTAAYAYNSFMIFMSFMLVYLVRRRIFMRLLIAFFWLVLGIINGTILSSRVTPFTGQDLHLITDALDVVKNYMSPVQLILKIGGVVLGALILLLLWKYAPRYQKKIHWPLNLAAVAAVVAVLGAGAVAVGAGAFSVLHPAAMVAISAAAETMLMIFFIFIPPDSSLKRRSGRSCNLELHPHYIQPRAVAHLYFVINII